MTGPDCTCPRDDPWQRDCPIHGDDWIPRWDQDKVVLANGWAVGRCGNCGADLTDRERAARQDGREEAAREIERLRDEADSPYWETLNDAVKLARGESL